MVFESLEIKKLQTIHESQITQYHLLKVNFLITTRNTAIYYIFTAVVVCRQRQIDSSDPIILGPTTLNTFTLQCKYTTLSLQQNFIHIFI